jgi:hypothetical protein
MTGKRRVVFTISAFFLFNLACAARARADDVTLNIIDPFRDSTPGAVEVFSGTLTNNTSSAITVVFGGFTGQGFSAVGANGVGGVFSITPLLQTPLVLAPNSTTGLLPLLQISTAVNETQAFAIGSFQVFAAGADRLLLLGGQNIAFGVNFPVATPEPATLLLLGTGLAAVASARGRGRRRKSRRGRQQVSD